MKRVCGRESRDAKAKPAMSDDADDKSRKKTPGQISNDDLRMMKVLASVDSDGRMSLHAGT